jgi:vacuolar iron transporter family protein
MAPSPSFEDLPLEAVRRAAHYDHHHRSVASGGPRAAVFGASDGLVSNVALILGMAAADPSASVVRLAGIAGLIAGAVSMAAGEYISMKAQAELFEHELAVERGALQANPGLETLELAKIYQSRGIDAAQAMELAEVMMKDPAIALEVHAREELGIDPHDLGSPIVAGAWSFAAFATGAVLPLLPWFVLEGAAAVLAAVALGLLGALVLGGLVGLTSGRSVVRGALRQAAVAAAAAAITYGIGSAVGISV